jgi:hypothetical protein
MQFSLSFQSNLFIPKDVDNFWIEKHKKVKSRIAKRTMRLLEKVLTVNAIRFEGRCVLVTI